MILNASAPPPYDLPASEPNEFFKSFLQKKTQFKAKEFLMHPLYVLDKLQSFLQWQYLSFPPARQYFSPASVMVIVFLRSNH